MPQNADKTRHGVGAADAAKAVNTVKDAKAAKAVKANDKTPKKKASPESLSAFVDKITGSNTQRISEALGEGFVRLKLGEAEKRQALQDIRCAEDAVIEMLRNSRDAGANVIFVATHKADNFRYLTILDNGEGIPASFHKTIFEPRVTTKLDSASMDEWGIHGRGMALFSISANADLAEVSASAKGEGSAIKVLINLENLGEVKDQSTLPDFVTDEESEKILGPGPNNIYKTCGSFALSEGGDSLTFVGSDAEIVSSVRAFFSSSKGKGRFPDAPSESRFGILTPLMDAQDGEALVKAADFLGLSISERNAQRILAGEVKPVPDILRRIKNKPKTKKTKSAVSNQALLDIARNKRKIKITDEDRDQILEALSQDLLEFSERYYMRQTKDPKFAFRNGHLRLDYYFDIDTDV